MPLKIPSKNAPGAKLFKPCTTLFALARTHRYEAFVDCPRLLVASFADWLGVGSLEAPAAAAATTTNAKAAANANAATAATAAAGGDDYGGCVRQTRHPWNPKQRLPPLAARLPPAAANATATLCSNQSSLTELRWHKARPLGCLDM